MRRGEEEIIEIVVSRWRQQTIQLPVIVLPATEWP
jgi:hypothetical protein